MKLSSILGLNARTRNYSYRYNSREGKKIADSKILTNRMLRRADIAHPLIYVIFRDPLDVERYDWSKLPDAFALKPSRGLGGEGIIVVKKKSRDGKSWITSQKQKIGIDDLKLHTLDILEGAYSMGNVPDVAFVQEYVGKHPSFARYAFRGTPDIRVIVFNKIPVMAMLRLPTRESGGRANLHQGAIGVGVDIATGITTKAIWHGEQIYQHPDTNKRLSGIKIPDWNKILETAARAQEASHMGYIGVDIVLHPDKGPQVLELNAQPGLQIQLANMSGLKRRLDRVEDLSVADAEHGIKIAKALFTERYPDRLRAEKGIKTIGTKELVKIMALDGKREKAWAKVDTGAWRTSIDKTLAESLGLLKKENILWTKTFKSSLGAEKRPIIALTYILAGRKVKTIASVANREGLRRPLIIGRRDLSGFLIEVKSSV